MKTPRTDSDIAAMNMPAVAEGHLCNVEKHERAPLCIFTLLPLLTFGCATTGQVGDNASPVPLPSQTAQARPQTELPLPPGCALANPAKMTFFQHNGSPFVDTNVSHGQKVARASILIDTGWAGCTTIDPRLAQTIGFESSGGAPLCRTTSGYQGVSVGPWAGYQVASYDMRAKDKLPQHPDQLATIAAGTLVEQMVEFDFDDHPDAGGALTVFAPSGNSCTAPTHTLDVCRARWSGIITEKIPLIYFSSCPATLNAQTTAHVGETLPRPAVPTVQLDIAGVPALIQIDTGRDTSNGFVDVSVNKPLLDAINMITPLRQTFSKGDLSDCQVSAYIPADPRGELWLAFGKDKKVVPLQQVVLQQGRTCQAPYTWAEPAGLMGMSIMKMMRRLVIDPDSGTLLVEWRPRQEQQQPNDGTVPSMQQMKPGQQLRSCPQQDPLCNPDLSHGMCAACAIGMGADTTSSDRDNVAEVGALLLACMATFRRRIGGRMPSRRKPCAVTSTISTS